jgi:hypothetical protein
MLTTNGGIKNEVEMGRVSDCDGTGQVRTGEEEGSG